MDKGGIQHSSCHAIGFCQFQEENCFFPKGHNFRIVCEIVNIMVVSKFEPNCGTVLFFPVPEWFPFKNPGIKFWEVAEKIVHENPFFRSFLKRDYTCIFSQKNFPWEDQFFGQLGDLVGERACWTGCDTHLEFEDDGVFKTMRFNHSFFLFFRVASEKNHWRSSQKRWCCVLWILHLPHYCPLNLEDVALPQECPMHWMLVAGGVKRFFG